MKSVSVSSSIGSFLFCAAWITGVALSNSALQVAGTILIPPYSFYVVAERVITTYTPELLR